MHIIWFWLVSATKKTLEFVIANVVKQSKYISNQRAKDCFVPRNDDFSAIFLLALVNNSNFTIENLNGRINEIFQL